ncbi:MAG TPA: cytochrome c [Syntrophales bacterium]|nr:cytochrome c [Syntrophales bacterium]
MKRYKRIFMASLIPVLAAFIGSLIMTAQGIGQGSPAGEQLYRGYCAVCHGEKGDGKGIAAPSFGGKIADFTNAEFWSKTDDKKILNVILKGQGRMPAQSVSPDEAKAIVEYMKSAFKGRYGS